MNAPQFMVHVAQKQQDTDFVAVQVALKLARQAVRLNQSSDEAARLKIQRDSLERIEGRFYWARICRQHYALERLGIDAE